MKASSHAREGLVSDRLWLGALYDAHAGDVRRVLRRLLGPTADVEDALQDIFLVALRRRDELERKRIDLGPWLYGVAVRTSQSVQRRRSVREIFGLETAEQVPTEEDPDLELTRNEASRLVYAALSKLNPKKRTVFILYELEGKRGEEIAQILDCPLKTVWSRLLHARREFTAAIQRLSAREEMQR